MADLYLSQLHLSHFRSHKSVRLALDGRPIAIHGANGAGKTNILEAVSLLSPGRGLRRAKSDEIARAPEHLGWKVSGQLHSLAQIHEVETRAEHGANRTVTIDAKTAAQIALGRIARIVWLIPADLIDSADALRDALDRSRPNDLRAGRTLAGPHRADLAAIYTAKNIEAKQCSTGEQKALLISLILANARALSEDFGAPPIILLDEVAAHLDASRRAALYDEISTLGAQAWMTGTGPELFEELGDRAQHVEVTESSDGSEILVT